MQVNVLDNFRDNVRSVIESSGISQRDLAERADLSYPYVNRLLVGKVEPTLPVCDRIADAIGVAFRDLCLPHKIFLREHLTVVSQ